MRKNCLNYPVEFAKDVFAAENGVLADVLKKVTGAERPRVLIVADMNVVQRTEGLGRKIGAWVQAFGVELAASPVVVSGGERAKNDNLQTVLRVMTAALDAKVGANDAVLAIGGGTVLDVAGYAAAQVRGGVKLVRLPTTVAAMVDGAFAETAAVDTACIKDALRVPCAPAAVVIDTTFATTILDGVWRGGFSEAVRLACVSDATLTKKLAKLAEAFRGRDFDAMDELVRDAVALRQKKGGTDFALWSALRLEAMSGYKLPHGYAVALGILVDARYAEARGLMKAEERELLAKMLSDCGALEAALHSRPLLDQSDSVLRGLDAWTLAKGSPAIVVPAGLGKQTVEESPDRDTMKTAMNLVK